MATIEPQAKPPRRWLRFSLRTLLVFMLLASIGLGWLGNIHLHVRKQQAIVAQIEAAGGQVFYAHQLQRESSDPPGPKLLRWWLGENAFAQVKMVNVDEDLLTDGLHSLAVLPDIEILNIGGISDDSLGQIEDLTQLKELSVGGRGLTNQGLQQLAKFPKLRSVDLYQTSVTDEGLVILGGLRKLRSLSLHSNGITDRGLQHLLALPELENLHLSDTQITDDGMKSIARLTKLRTLKIHETAITDLGAESLAGLKELDWLMIGPHISRDAARELKGALPNCAIWGYDRAGEYQF